jgi:hypothetical protein
LETWQCQKKTEVIPERKPIWIKVGGGKMTVLELISRWTPEERESHMDLILECLERERFLMEMKRSFKRSEEELKQSLDLLSSGINNLAQTARENADQILSIYLRLAKGGGNG